MAPRKIQAMATAQNGRLLPTLKYARLNGPMNLAPPSFRAGAASLRITPDEPMWLAGFAVRTEPAKGKLSDLYVKAMAIEDERGNRVVIVSIDLIAISKSVATKVCNEAKRQFGLSRDQVMLCATHTHYGPELRPDKVPFFHIPDEYAEKIQPFADRLAQTIVDVIGKSLEQLRPTTLRVAESEVSFASNRRDSDDPIDHAVPVLIAEGVGIVFGYACHNTTMPPADCLYSGDWAGFACEQIEREFPGHVAMFLMGAGADQNPVKGSAEVSEAHGKALGDAVRNALRAAKPQRGGIATAFEEVELQYQPLPSRESLINDLQGDDQPKGTKAKFLLDALDRGEKFNASYPCPIQIIRIGEQLLIIAIGGEPVIDYAINLKKMFPGKLVWVVGYANDMFGYVPTPRVLRGGGYEGTRSVLWSALPMPFTDSVEQHVIQKIREMQSELAADKHR